MNPAWEQVSRVVDEPAWYWVYDKLRFWPSTFPHAWPGFAEPSPSVTWDLSASDADRGSAEFRLGPNSIEADEVNRIALHALRDCVKLDEWVWVLHWQHQSYKFYPHRMGEGQQWPVSVFPQGDYHLFLASDYRFGTLGHPWERSLCVYGKDLTTAFERHGKEKFTKELRRDGTALDSESTARLGS
ncbi:DUF2716 domain-containing protein [Amycolatopsis sp. NPDC059657]|uniref:DUF2716 domain-containing protein n=1 Tax=Amycolatopsis sp. NPDC059657 TaxID=3346899 RepID=UPI00366EE497